MKKGSIKLRDFLERQRIRKFLHEHKRAEIRRKLRLSLLPEKIRLRKDRKLRKHPEKITFEECKAPTEFSLINDPIKVILYFENAKKAFKKHLPVHLDLSEVKDMGPETLTYLCALINDKQFTNRSFLQGTSPKDSVLKQCF
jgi:hypothetical protein